MESISACFAAGAVRRWAGELSDNGVLLAGLAAFARAGGVVYAECGGLIYLSASIQPQGDLPVPMGACVSLACLAKEGFRRVSNGRRRGSYWVCGLAKSQEKKGSYIGCVIGSV